ncbi:hypothetical protein GCM10007036_28780 [Alsobacter metallidurans]|uniref:Uncharacterized protein n=1 Tax=Alsobacter metallidurans TaxID=340221 RepID=A0A917I8K4_9HYPH|nr:hypothetical protein GCM10007036_28780 [Alsobacter metallidurans]
MPFDAKAPQTGGREHQVGRAKVIQGARDRLVEGLDPDGDQGLLAIHDGDRAAGPQFRNGALHGGVRGIPEGVGERQRVFHVSTRTFSDPSRQRSAPAIG